MLGPYEGLFKMYGTFLSGCNILRELIEILLGEMKNKKV